MKTCAVKRLELKSGIDDRHERVVAKFNKQWNECVERHAVTYAMMDTARTKTKIDLCVRRVLPECRILAKDKGSSRYYLVEMNGGKVSGRPLASLDVGELFTEAKENPHKYAVRFRNFRLYRRLLFNEKEVFI